jgi:hypothetical protein
MVRAEANRGARQNQEIIIVNKAGIDLKVYVSGPAGPLVRRQEVFHRTYYNPNHQTRKDMLQKSNGLDLVDITGDFSIEDITFDRASRQTSPQRLQIKILRHAITLKEFHKQLQLHQYQSFILNPKRETRHNHVRLIHPIPFFQLKVNYFDPALFELYSTCLNFIIYKKNVNEVKDIDYIHRQPEA